MSFVSIKGLRNDYKAALDRLDQEELDSLAKHEVLYMYTNITGHKF